MENKIFFVSGLPRSGSTLLMNFLGQNPNHHVTPTSGLIELFVLIKNRWREFTEFKAQGLEIVKPRIEKTMKGVVYGFFEEEFNQKKVVFDKSRGWIQYIEVLEEVLERQVKVIVTVRSIKNIVASFEKIYRNRQIEFIEATGEDFFKTQTIRGRADLILKSNKILGLSINRLRDAVERGLKDRLVIVPYYSFVCNPMKMISDLHKKLELDWFYYDPNNVKQITYENDMVHGMDLHNIKNEIKIADKDAWKDVLPEDLAFELDQRYDDINKLCCL
jgi:sulfotransferase